MLAVFFSDSLLWNVQVQNSLHVVNANKNSKIVLQPKQDLKDLAKLSVLTEMPCTFPRFGTNSSRVHSPVVVFV